MKGIMRAYCDAGPYQGFRREGKNERGVSVIGGHEEPHRGRKACHKSRDP